MLIRGGVQKVLRRCLECPFGEYDPLKGVTKFSSCPQRGLCEGALLQRVAKWQSQYDDAAHLKIYFLTLHDAQNTPLGSFETNLK